MAKPVLLNNVEHADLRVAARFGAEHGHSANFVQVYPPEFVDVAREYPILFAKDADGAWFAGAVLGLDADENLFLEGQEWRARYIPAVLDRGPFSIGVERAARDASPEPMIYIDLEDARVSRTEGQPVFKPQGGNTRYLDQISETLRRLYFGLETAPKMFEAFEAAELLTPMALQAQLSEGNVYQFQDFYTISPEKLADLPGATLQSLNRQGYLGLAFIAISSLGNVARLIDLKLSRSTTA